MSFGVSEPTKMAFSMTFSGETLESAIMLVVNQLAEDGWTVQYEKDTRTLSAQNEIVTVKPPTVVQGEPDVEYMGEKMYRHYCEECRTMIPMCDWKDLGPGERAGWIDFYKAVKPCLS
jgi:hypothetical protein